VSRGLIILAKDCEALLRGTVYAQNKEQFTHAWDLALRHFDEQVELMGDRSTEMFIQVEVDGNCHALCRKLENLIKTFFAQMQPQQNLHQDILESPSRAPSRDGDGSGANGGGVNADSPGPAEWNATIERDPYAEFMSEDLETRRSHAANDVVGSYQEQSAADLASRQALAQSGDFDSSPEQSPRDWEDEGQAQGKPTFLYESPPKEDTDSPSGRADANTGDDTAAEATLETTSPRRSSDTGTGADIANKTDKTDKTEADKRSSSRGDRSGRKSRRESPRGDRSSRGSPRGKSDILENPVEVLEEMAGLVQNTLGRLKEAEAVHEPDDLAAASLADVSASYAGSDEESMVMPSYAKAAPPPSSDELAVVEPELSPREQSVMREMMDRFDLIIESSTTPTLAVAVKKVNKLADLYPHIGMMFPVAYSQLGPKNSDSIDARALIESMQQQSKLYEEWIEVMADYATVFSDERGITKAGDDATRSSSVYSGGSQALHYRVKSARQEVYDIVTDVFQKDMRGKWEELPSGLGLGVSWNLLWTWSKPRINMTHLLVWQRVNHFQDSKQLTRKDLLKKNLQRFTDMTGKASSSFEIMPQTYILPQEYTQLVQAFHADERQREAKNEQNYWILKPVGAGASRGRGISLIRDVNALVYSQSSVVQRYIERPLCLDGYKFDLRIYVLVTSFKPLEAFIYKEGFARVCMAQYSLQPNDMGNSLIHLTNSSINQHVDAAADNPIQDNAETMGGSKIPLHGPHGLWQRLEAGGMDIDLIWRNICVCILKSLVVVDERMTHQPCCFEVFGYDVLLDENLKPWLIEVNASPSMSRVNSLDVRVKNGMIRDTINLIDPPPYDRAGVARVIKRRLTDITKNKFTMNKNDPKLEDDLREILGKQVPRQVGEDPKKLGDYQKLCPNTKIHQHVLRLKGKIIKPLK
jgi:hypothetical protein